MKKIVRHKVSGTVVEFEDDTRNPFEIVLGDGEEEDPTTHLELWVAGVQVLDLYVQF